MAMPELVTLAQLRIRAARLWERDGRRWAAGDVESAIIDIPLHPPTEQDMLRNYTGTEAWVKSWRQVPSQVEVTWEHRRWSRGEQDVPTRVRVAGAASIADLAFATDQWRRWRTRADELIAVLGTPDRLRPALTTHARTIGELDTTDFHRLRDVAKWLQSNPASGRFVRELPIRGIDSKWLERHRSLVEALVGSDRLGLRQAPELVRVRFLDPSLSSIGLIDLTAPLAEITRLAVDPRRVLIVENLQTFLALPERPGVIAVDGHGNVASRLAEIEWIVSAQCVYWGDLDSHGLRILSQARGVGLRLDSCLMDAETLLTFRDLWIPEPRPFRGELPSLTPSERETLRLLREEGNIRLEQERISWDYALTHLDSEL